MPATTSRISTSRNQRSERRERGPSPRSPDGIGAATAPGPAPPGVEGRAAVASGRPRGRSVTELAPERVASAGPPARGPVRAFVPGPAPGRPAAVRDAAAPAPATAPGRYGVAPGPAAAAELAPGTGARAAG